MFKPGRQTNSNKTQINSFEILVLFLVIGWLFLAILDPEFRSSFVKISELGVGCFLGYTLPKIKKN